MSSMLAPMFHLRCFQPVHLTSFPQTSTGLVLTFHPSLQSKHGCLTTITYWMAGLAHDGVHFF
ncbi:hypothetical protein BDR07DRAFT_1438588, partial [Suillus spraguei]